MKRRKTYSKYHDTSTKRTENSNNAKHENFLLKAMLFSQLTNSMTGGGYNTDTTTKTKEEF